MTEPPVPKAVVVPSNDPVYSVYVWRQDSITLARLRPILSQLLAVPDQPCLLENTCTSPGLTCIPCSIRSIKRQLFGEEGGGGPRDLRADP
jgi:hypothetical protein